MNKLWRKYDIKELEEQLKKCKNIDLNEVNIDNIDELIEIKISRKKTKKEKIARFYKQN